MFEGFLPKKAGDRRRRIDSLLEEPRTLVLYVSPHHVAEHIRDLREGLGDRPAALARELTKLHEEVRRGSLSELLQGVEEEEPRGEIVLVVGGATGAHRREIPAESLARRARALMAEGMDRKQALSRVAKDAGVPRRRVFDSLLGKEGEGET